MKALAINGSPRMEGTTEVLLNDVLNGVMTMGGETEQIHLYDLDFKGCRSCFGCKVTGSKRYGYCVVNDALKPIFDKIHDDIDALVIGSPIYFGDVTGEIRIFLERLFYQLLDYSVPPTHLLKKQIPVLCVYTMNQPQEKAIKFGYHDLAANLKSNLERFVGPSEYMMSYDNPVFLEYSHFVTDCFDEKHKALVREVQFPAERAYAKEMGIWLYEKACKVI